MTYNLGKPYKQQYDILSSDLRDNFLYLKNRTDLINSFISHADYNHIDMLHNISNRNIFNESFSILDIDYPVSYGTIKDNDLVICDYPSREFNLIDVTSEVYSDFFEWKINADGNYRIYFTANSERGYSYHKIIDTYEGGVSLGLVPQAVGTSDYDDDGLAEPIACAQSFTLQHDCSGIVANLKFASKSGSPKFTAKLYNDNAGVIGSLVSSLVVTSLVNDSLFSVYKKGGLTLSSGSKYWIVLANNGSVGESFGVMEGHTSSQFAGGNVAYNTDKWYYRTDVDWSMKLYEYIEGQTDVAVSNGSIIYDEYHIDTNENHIGYIDAKNVKAGDILKLKAKVTNSDAIGHITGFIVCVSDYNGKALANAETFYETTK